MLVELRPLSGCRRDTDPVEAAVGLEPDLDAGAPIGLAEQVAVAVAKQQQALVRRAAPQQRGVKTLDVRAVDQDVELSEQRTCRGIACELLETRAGVRHQRQRRPPCAELPCEQRKLLGLPERLPAAERHSCHVRVVEQQFRDLGDRQIVSSLAREQLWCDASAAAQRTSLDP